MRTSERRIPVLSLHPRSSTGGTSVPATRRDRIRSLAVAGACLAVLAVLSGGTGLVALAVVTLGTAAVLCRRAGHGSPRPAPSRLRTAPLTSLAAGPVEPEDLTARLRQLHDDHVEQVNMALAEDREDLVQELSDNYMDESLALITAAGRRSTDTFLIP
jgi:hypothetical protein